MFKLLRLDERLIHGQVAFALDKFTVSGLYFSGK